MAWKHSWWSDMGEFFHQPNVKSWNNSQMFQGYHWWWRLNVSVYSWGSCIPTPWLFNEGVLLWRHCTWRRFFFISSAFSKNGCGMCFCSFKRLVWYSQKRYWYWFWKLHWILFTHVLFFTIFVKWIKSNY